jgi:hypothetical protein
MAKAYGEIIPSFGILRLIPGELIILIVLYLYPA